MTDYLTSVSSGDEIFGARGDQGVCGVGPIAAATVEPGAFVTRERPNGLREYGKTTPDSIEPGRIRHAENTEAFTSIANHARLCRDRAHSTRGKTPSVHSVRQLTQAPSAMDSAVVPAGQNREKSGGRRA